jgi:hypothetical protein
MSNAHSQAPALNRDIKPVEVLEPEKKVETTTTAPESGATAGRAKAAGRPRLLQGPSPTSSFYVGVGSLFFVGIVLAVGGYLLTYGYPVGLTILIGATGFLLGVPLGMLLSPHKGEGRDFRSIGAYLATFFSGYVLSKLTTGGVERWFAAAATNPLHGGRIVLFVGFFLLGVLQTFIIRSYGDEVRKRDSLIVLEKDVQEGQNNASGPKQHKAAVGPAQAASK